MVPTLYTSLLAVTCLAGLGVAALTWRNRETAAAQPLVVMSLAAVFWTGGTVGLTLASTPMAKLRWLQFSYIGIIASPIAYALVAVTYTGYVQSFPTRAVAALSGVGAVFLGLVWTNPSHRLYWADIDYSVAVPEGLTTIPGPGFWAFVVFTYGLLGVGSVLYFKYAITAPGLYRRQTAALFVAVAAPWAANIPHALQLMAADFTPVAISVTVGALWVAMFRYQLTEVDPIALRTVFERISTGVIVLDHQNRIIDINPTSRELFGVSEVVIGTPLEDVVHAELYPLFQRETVDDEIVTLGEAGSDQRFVEVSVTPTEVGEGRRDSRVVVLTEVTELKRQHQQLEAQNERLDEFTSVVSHDLRNPLNVAQGRLELARQECDSDHLKPVANAHERMGQLIDDLLTLAKHGSDIHSRQSVSVAAIAERAWSNVEVFGATVDIRIDRTIEADPNRLQQLFENLFRNAVDHGGTDVTVTVGEQHNGFYIEDTGPGIPQADRKEIFETGYTTTGDGTGFGLAIVSRIVEAHGWEVEASTGTDGGARFDITAVTFVESMSA